MKERIHQDSRSELESIGSLQQKCEELLKRADTELEIIRPALQDIARRIDEEKPDIVAFLDKGARLFATPMRRYLHELGHGSLPDFKFYNDEMLKSFGSDRTIVRDFGPYAGKKIFFIDESYSRGVGATAILKATSAAGIDASYFALSRVSVTGDDPRSQEIRRRLAVQSEAVKKGIIEGKLKIYDNPLTTIFTKEAAKLYVFDDFDHGGTGTERRYKSVSPENATAAFDYPSYHPRGNREPDGASDWMEFDQKLMDINMRTVSVLQDKIYNALKQSGEQVS